MTAWLAYDTQHVTGRYQQALDIADSLAGSESRLSRAVLEARQTPLANYDTLNVEFSRMRTDLDRLAHLVSKIDDQYLGREVAQLELEQEARSLLIDQFRRDNAIVKNSLQYFPHAIHDLIDAGGTEAAIPRADLAMLSQVMLLYIAQVTSENHAQLDLWFATVQRAHSALTQESARKLDLALKHAANIRDVLPRLNETTRQLTSPEGQVKFQHLRDRLVTIAREHERTINLLLVVFMLFAILMAVLLTQLWRRWLSGMKLASTVFDASPEGIMITDAKARILNVNPAFCKMRGYLKEELVGFTPSTLKSGEHTRGFYRDLWNALIKNGHWNGEISNRSKDGGTIHEWVSINSILNENAEIVNYVAVYTDLTQRHEAEEKIRFLAYHDALTSLPNRELLKDRATQVLLHAAREKHKFALMLIDLDQFKNINDTLGHSVGDQLLLSIAKRMRDSLRDVDTLSRLGGDEFVLLSSEVKSLEDAECLAVKVLSLLSEPFNIDDQILRVTASIGIAVYPDNGSDYETLFRQADTAMYNAKHNGRNGWSFPSGRTDDLMLEYLSLHVHLANAVDSSEIHVHYQPQIDLRSGTVKGVEALARWQHPQLGLISPARFIPVAESTGLIIPIGAYILQEACRQARTWDNAGLSVAVNVSAVQFRRGGDLLDAVRCALKDSGLEPTRLEIELTESLLMDDVEKAVETLRQLKQLGVRVSIDDFGTGYSSLSYLKQLDIDALKIDQSFVRDIETDPNDAAIVLAIIQLATALGMETVAEGIEHRGQLEFLVKNGCLVGQGYKFLPPQIATEVTAFLEKWEGIACT